MNKPSVVKSGGYTVAQIDAMNEAQLKIAIVTMSKLYKQSPSEALGKVIVYTLQRLEDREAARNA